MSLTDKNSIFLCMLPKYFVEIALLINKSKSLVEADL
jgi:hypothetical protein